MRIIIDLQGRQSTGSRNRGIGKYSLAITKALLRNKKNHEIFIVLNGCFVDTIEPICAELAGLLESSHIRVWTVPPDVRAHSSFSNAYKDAAAFIREYYISQLKPDIVLITSLFEGFGDDAVTSLHTLDIAKYPTAVILYDLIPLIFKDIYLSDSRVSCWYSEKIRFLKQADLVLSISEATRDDAIKYLDVNSTQIVNISSSVEHKFHQYDVASNLKKEIKNCYGIDNNFIMYTGGIDFRKNIEGLIEAYSLLPSEIHKKYTLVIVCAISSQQKDHLIRIQGDLGLTEREVVYTGYVPEEHLIALYNMASLFVFPSKYEGFGLPILEAMSCGTPVLASNTSSMPEVIGNMDALFDPMDPKAIASKILHVLLNPKELKHMKILSLKQAQNFSWDISAQKTVSAIENLQNYWSRKSSLSKNKKTTLAYISPLPPIQSGIADYSVELLPELSKYYNITVIINQNDISDLWIKDHCEIQTEAWFYDHYDQFDRILYQFGNSEFHSYMVNMLKKIPGTVVLHDFYLSGLFHWRQHHLKLEHEWEETLYKSHGYKAFADATANYNTADSVWKYPASLSVIEQANGIIAHSHNSVRLAKNWYGHAAAEKFKIVPHLRVNGREISKSSARMSLGIPESAFVVCSFGLLGPSKQNHRLLDAWKFSSLGDNNNAILVFVGQNDKGTYGHDLSVQISTCAIPTNIVITGWADKEMFINYLAAADVGVQLRTLSRGETSGTVLDCMNYGVPTIVNRNGTMDDLPDHCVLKISDDFTDEELKNALELLWNNKAKRDVLGQNSKIEIQRGHSPKKCAALYHDAIESFYTNDEIQNPYQLIRTIAQIEGLRVDTPELQYIAQSIAANHKLLKLQKQLYIDISELIIRDSDSGRQRVIKSILTEFITNPPSGYRIEPVYATLEQQGYKYAGKFMAKFLDIPRPIILDDLIAYQRGDVFVGLDVNMGIISNQELYLNQLYDNGVQVYFVIYDLLPVLLPERFGLETMKSHANWLRIASSFNGVCCISKSVCEEMSHWVQQNSQENITRLKITPFHLGADISNPVASLGLQNEAQGVLTLLALHPSFLMVGTIEPRKRQDLALEAFEKLWSAGLDINLVIVGKKGWKTEALCKKLMNHPEVGKHLFWLNGISDEYLEKVYAASTCLIAASEGEGFGLPLIEAAQKKLPIIARDIPVFREVAGEYAYYFSGKTGDELAEAVKDWLALYKAGKHPKSDNMPWLTWKESAQQLLKAIGIEEIQ